MPDRLQLSDTVTIGAQPTEAELQAMADDGVATIINLRHEGEDMQPLPPDAQGEVVRRLGMAYTHVPVSMKDADADLVDRFREALCNAKGPVFVHCKLGARAGAFVMLDLAAKHGWDGRQTLEQAQKLGFVCDHEKLTDFMREQAGRASG